MIERTLVLLGYLMLTGVLLVIIGWLWGMFRDQIFLRLGNYIPANSTYSQTYYSLIAMGDKVFYYVGAILFIGAFIWFILEVIRSRSEPW